MLVAVDQVIQNKFKFYVDFKMNISAGSRLTNSGLSSRGGSGFNMVPEHGRLSTPHESNRSSSLRSLRLHNLQSSAGSTDSGFVQPIVG